MIRFLALPWWMLAAVHAAPVISSITPPTAPTQGGVEVTISGTGLDDNDPVLGNEEPMVTLNNQPLTIVGNPSPTQIVFILPQGQGANLPVKVTLDGDTGTGLFSYFPPSIGTVSGSSPTGGGGTVNIGGSNFGLSGTVTIGGAPAGVVSWSHTAITVLAPAGQGSDRPVVVTSGGQASAPGPAASFDYLPPSVSGIAAGSRPTAGGVPITLNGNNFGTSATLTFNGVPVAIVSQTHNTVTFTLPEGEGTALPIQVVVAGQTHAPFGFDYDAPVILDIDPAVGPAPAATEITLTGSNFGLNPTVIFGTGVGVLVSHSHDEIVFVRPSGEEGCLEVSVAVAGQVSSAVDFLSTPLTSPPGYFIDVPNGQILPAPAGRIAPNPNMTETLEPVPGFYAPVPGMSQAIPASPGYYVPVSGSDTQLPAPAGSYVSLQGQSGPTTAEVGTYAPIAGLRAPIPAPEGTYAPAGGLSEVLPVPPGFESSDGVTLTALPAIQIVASELLPGGDFRLTFSTSATDTYGVFYSEDLVNFTMIQTVPGTGGDVQIDSTPPNPAATRRFWVVGPVPLPVE